MAWHTHLGTVANRTRDCNQAGGGEAGHEQLQFNFCLWKGGAKYPTTIVFVECRATVFSAYRFYGSSLQWQGEEEGALSLIVIEGGRQ